MNITTTYRDDYEWPFVKNLPIPPITFEIASQLCQYPNEQLHKICNEQLHKNVPRQECKTPTKSDSYEWSRLGPMGFLLEPKLYAVNTNSNVCAGKSMKCNEVKNWMTNVAESSILQKPSMPGYDTLRMIHEDRLKSTYQLDYDHLAEYPYIDYHEEMKQRKKPPDVECRVPVRPPYIGGHDIPGRPSRNNELLDNNSPSAQNVERRTTTTVKKATINQDTKSKEKIITTPKAKTQTVAKAHKKGNAQPHLKANAKPTAKTIQASPANAPNAPHLKPNAKPTANAPTNTGQMQSMEAWTSEYSDVISYTADEIIRNQLHYASKKSKGGK